MSKNHQSSSSFRIYFITSYLIFTMWTRKYLCQKTRNIIFYLSKFQLNLNVDCEVWEDVELAIVGVYISEHSVSRFIIPQLDGAISSDSNLPVITSRTLQLVNTSNFRGEQTFILNHIPTWCPLTFISVNFWYFLNHIYLYTQFFDKN